MLKVLMTRYGGHGDLVMLEPTIEAIYYRWKAVDPDVTLTFRTYKDHVKTVQNNPFIDDVILDDNRYATGHRTSTGFHDWTNVPGAIYNLLYNFQGAIEPHHGLHGVDAWAAASGVPLLRRTPAWHFPPGMPVEREGDPPILFCYLSPSSNRSLPAGELIRLGVRHEWVGQDPNWDIQQLAQAIWNARLVVGVDSAPLHMAAALGTRAIGIYTGEFPAAIRAYPGFSWVSTNELHLLPDLIDAELSVCPGSDKLLNQGDATASFKTEALRYMKGIYLDVGPGAWPLHGAIPCDRDLHSKLLDEQPDGFYDGIHSSHCLEHVNDWKSELSLWDAKSKPGAFLALYLPHPKFKPWRPGGVWVGSNHLWALEPIEVVRYLMLKTNWEVFEYTSTPDPMMSYKIFARKRMVKKDAPVPIFGDGIHDFGCNGIPND